MKKVIVAIIASMMASSFVSSGQTSGHSTMPHLIVYKTKKHYNNLVAVQLSDDKKKVVSYPDPADVKTGSAKTVLPVSLHHGYLLDRRGVNVNTAFIKLTYEHYAALKKVPSPEELYEMVVDKDPISELCDCGVRGKYTIRQLNSMIDRKSLRTNCKAIK